MDPQPNHQYEIKHYEMEQVDGTVRFRHKATYDCTASDVYDARRQIAEKYELLPLVDVLEYRRVA